MNSSLWSARWLASACDDPISSLREWRLSERGVMLVPAGRLWDALAVPETLGHSLLNAVARSGHARTGPVLRNSRRQEFRAAGDSWEPRREAGASRSVHDDRNLACRARPRPGGDRAYLDHPARRTRNALLTE